MTLITILADLAARLPERVKWLPEVGEYAIWVDFGQDLGIMRTQSCLHPDGVPMPLELAALRLTLEQECEARGWSWHVSSRLFPDSPQASANVRTGDNLKTLSGALADTPVEALAQAVLSALEAQ